MTHLFDEDMNTHYEDILYPLQDKILTALNAADTALVGRDDPKDIVDLWVVATHLSIDWRDVFTDISSRAAGIFPPLIAEKIATLPLEHLDVIKWAGGKKPNPERIQKDLADIADAILVA